MQCSDYCNIKRWICIDRNSKKKKMFSTCYLVKIDGYCKTIDWRYTRHLTAKFITTIQNKTCGMEVHNHLLNTPFQVNKTEQSARFDLLLRLISSSTIKHEYKSIFFVIFWPVWRSYAASYHRHLVNSRLQKCLSIFIVYFIKIISPIILFHPLKIIEECLMTFKPHNNIQYNVHNSVLWAQMLYLSMAAFEVESCLLAKILSVWNWDTLRSRCE